ncbi:winged helix-turn-helix domain-containing protein [Asticcacaulis sp. DW145]|uniref:hypothetical protein n=1 Tax=Asticcacaulis sp. DW145 TaxID=3095608 RepID=UPI003084EB51|nr:winged helix-turn-helix domain-containing protein [Asticcacaulis sp. DW145]
MTNAYLDLAEEVITIQRMPLSAREIMDYAFMAGIAPSHIFGVTPHKTLHARLAVDILNYPETTQFFRTAPGRFFLKRFQADTEISSQHKKIYIAPQRRKELKRDAVLVLEPSDLPPLEESGGYIALEELYDLLGHGRYKYMQGRQAEKTSNVIPVHSFVLFKDGGNVLSYNSGRIHQKSDPLIGSRSIGFGSVVLQSDQDILYNSLLGIIENAISEVAHALGMPRELAEKARYDNELRPRFCMVVENNVSRQKHLFVILDFQRPSQFQPDEHSSSAAGFGWMGPGRLPNDISNYDELSQYMLQREPLDPRSAYHWA